MSDHILEVTSENFDEKVIKSNLPVLVDFWAEWCGPCKQLMPTVEKIALDYKGKAIVAKVNVDNYSDIAAQYNVRGIPNLLIFHSGEPQEQLVGNVPEKQITDILNKCGLIIGNKLDINNESLFFQRINTWMMSLLGSSWDNPKTFDQINKEIKKDIVSQLEKLITSRANTLYFGWQNIIKKGSFEKC